MIAQDQAAGPRGPLAVTMGEPAGIGPDIIIQSYAMHRRELPPFFVIGDVEFLKQRALRLGLDGEIDFAPLKDEIPHKFDRLFAKSLPVTNVTPRGIIRFCDRPGQPDIAEARWVHAALEMALAYIEKGVAGALVTGPIHKKTMYGQGFAFPGHTEFLADAAVKIWKRPVQPVMMLAGPAMRVVPVTIHIPLREVMARLTSDLIIQTARITAQALQGDFGLKSPRIAVCGLNPHAGEEGALGGEETEIIAPAIASLKAEGVDVCGPLAADTLFHPQARSQFDCVLAMYHDQALIPAKTIGFDEAVNTTLGLPFIRTSPDHGTALEIAGSGSARAGSFVAALFMADEMRNRRAGRFVDA